MSLAAKRGALVCFCVAAVAAAGCAASPTSPSASPSGTLASSASPRSGNLHVIKDCNNTYQGQAGDFCTITASNLDAIKGSKITYAHAADFATLTLASDIVLNAPGPGNNLAFGHCSLSLATGAGRCTFSGGTGKFTHFQGVVDVSPAQTAGFFAWDGTYSFSPND